MINCVILKVILSCRKKERLTCRGLVCKMADYEETKVATIGDVTSGNMIFEAILEDGVFRFDCSADDRVAAYPSFSFTNTKIRDTPIQCQTVPSFTPTFETRLGEQIVKLEVS